MRNAILFVLGAAALAAFNGCGPMPVPLPPDLIVDDVYGGEATYPIFVPVSDDGGGHVTASVVGNGIDRYLNDLVWEDDGEFAGWSAGRYPAGEYSVTVCSENQSGKDCKTFAVTLGGGGSGNGGSGGNGGQGGNGGSGGTGGDGGAGTGGNGGWVINNDSGSVTIIIGDGNVVDNGDGDANGGGSGGGDNPPPDEPCNAWTTLPAGVVVVKTGVRTVPTGDPQYPVQTFAGLSVLKDGHVLTEADLPLCQELNGIEVIVQGTGFLNNEYSRSSFEAVVTPDEVDLWKENVVWVYLYIWNMETETETPFLVPIQ